MRCSVIMGYVDSNWYRVSTEWSNVISNNSVNNIILSNNMSQASLMVMLPVY